MLGVKELQCEGRKKPLGVDQSIPKFSFLIDSNETNVVLTAYRIQISLKNEWKENIVWDSGKVLSEQSIDIQYNGKRLSAHTRYFYRIKIWDNKGNESNWSDLSFFDTAFVNGTEWSGNFIGTDDELELNNESPCTVMRKEFYLKDDVEFAKAYMTAKGLYELHLNGEKVGEDYLTPGYTNYNNKLQYQAYDITHDLKQGKNSVGIILGDGWYKGYVNWDFKRNFFGNRRKALMEINVQYKNGQHEKIVTDENFVWSDSAIRISEIFQGEIYDARKELTGFDRVGFDDQTFKPVVVFDDSKTNLVAEQNESIKLVQKIKPKSIIKTPKNETVLDMGQNMVGQIQITIKGNRGERVRLKHGEVLDKKGNFYDENIKNSIGPAKQEIVYTLKGGGSEVYCPHFTYQCFRYVKIVDFPGEPAIENFEGHVISSFTEETGTFECSNPLINQLQHNIVWSQLGNFMDIPIAGPQRAERVGWTGDAQIFAKTACFNMNAKLFFTKWLNDLKYDQYPNGAVPRIVPNVLDEQKTANADLNRANEAYPTSAGWGDAALIIPWILYMKYGDKNILINRYESMKRYVEFMRHEGENEHLYNTGFHFGDWFALDGEEGNFYGATPKEYVATAFYAYSTELLVKTAQALGYTEDEKAYRLLRKNILKAFQKQYVDNKGHLNIKTQSACVLALQFGLVDNKSLVCKDLVKYLHAYDDHLSTGFIGTSYICHVLSDNGYVDLAYSLLLNTDCPSWLYQVKKGATTIWEHWDGIKSDGTFWSPWMNSFNHYALGSIGDWMYSVIGGIQQDEEKPGYKHFYINPQPGGGLTFAETELKTVYGLIKTRWEKEENKWILRLSVPPNTTATVMLPANKENKRIFENKGHLVIIKENKMAFTIGSGHYSFSC